MEKLRVVYVKCIWIGGNFNISEGGFANMFFLLYPLYKNIYLSKSFIWNVCVEVCKNFG
jgi:hypothetical protein